MTSVAPRRSWPPGSSGHGPRFSNTIRLLRLPAPVQRRVVHAVLGRATARALLALSDPVEQERLAQRIVAEGLSVRSVEEIVAVGSVARRPAGPRCCVLLPRAVHLAETLTDSLDTRVNVQIGKKRGRITIEFAGEEDLDRILVVLREGDTTNQ